MRSLKLGPAEPGKEPGAVAHSAVPTADRNGLGTAGRCLLTIAAFVVIVAGMKAAAALLVPFLLAVFIAVVCAPLFLALQRRGVPSAIALLAVILLMAGIVMIAVGVLERSLTGVAANLGRYEATLNTQMTQFFAWLEGHGIAAPDQTVREYLNTTVLLGYIGPIAGTLGDVLIKAFIILVVAVFILLEALVMPAKIRALPGVSTDAWERIREIVTDVRRYMLLKTAMSILTGVLVGCWLALLGVEFPILLGVLAFALNYIPNIGSFVASLPGILLALAEFGLGTAVITAGGYVIINVGISNGIEPRYMGYGLDLSPLVVITSVIFWGWVLGPLGMLLSVPLTMTLKIALENDEGTRWLAILMASRPPRRAAARVAKAPPDARAEPQQG